METRIEIVVEDAVGATIAAQEGAQSVELCTTLAQGGLTPSRSLMIEACKAIKSVNSTTECHILLLNKPSGFCLTKKDVDALRVNIRQAKGAGATGIVFGALTAENTLDIPALQILLKEAHPLQTTFHRAFDYINDQETALEQLINLGFTRLLTSGRPGKAPDHTKILKALVNQAKDRLIILIGGGVRLPTIQQLINEVHPTYLHMSAKNDDVEKNTCTQTSRTKIKDIMQSSLS